MSVRINFWNKYMLLVDAIFANFAYHSSLSLENNVILTVFLTLSGKKI